MHIFININIQEKDDIPTVENLIKRGKVIHPKT